VRSGYGSELEHRIREAIRACGGLAIRDRSRIVIKINLCDFRPPETGAITDPRFLDAFLGYLDDCYPDHEIYVVENEATSAAPDLFVE